MDTTTHILPAYCDLRPAVDEVEDQGTIGSCVANTGVKVAEVQLERLRDKYPDMDFPSKSFSRLYLYYWMRQFEVRLGEQGASPEDLWKVFQIKGVCNETLWPYDTSKQDVQPPTECDLDAKGFRVYKYESLMAGNNAVDWALAKDKSLLNIKHVLCQGRPVALSFNVTQDFQTQGGLQHDWRTFHWNAVPSAANPNKGGHAVLAIGFNESRILCQNSWNSTWGDGGFFGMPYELFGDLYNGVGTAYCSIQDTIGHIPIDSYLPRVWDAERQTAIHDFVTAKLKEVSDATSLYIVPGDELDAAMKWEAGLSHRLFGN